MQMRKAVSRGAVIVLGLSGAAASGQCEPEWSDVFTPAFFRGGGGAAATFYDDGTGVKLIVSDLIRADTGEPGLQVWDGQNWSTIALPAETIGDSQMVRAFNDHEPPRLVLADIQGNNLVEVYIYENGVWEATGFPVPEGFRFLTDIETGSDPAGDELFITGLFEGDGPMNTLVYHWDGLAWAAVDETRSGYSGTDLVWFDDGSGRKLYAAVRNVIDGVPAQGVARWDGNTWEEVGGGCPAYWPTLAVFDDGSGPALWALASEGDELARWDGASWMSFPLQSGDADYVWRLTPAEIGGEEAIYWTDRIAGHSRLWRWADGTAQIVAEVNPGAVNDLAVSADASLGTGIFAVGSFSRAGGEPMARAARWDGTEWNAMANEDVGNGAPGAGVMQPVGIDAGELMGGRLYVAASSVAGIDAGGVATWDGEQWAAIGPTDMRLVSVHAFELGDLGDGLRLFAGGNIKPDESVESAVIAWDGTEWTIVGSGVQWDTRALAFGALEGGAPTLYVGGAFTRIDGEVFHHVAALTEAGWAPLGEGLPSGTDPASVDALELHDDGTGVALYASGLLVNLAPEFADSVVRWDGHTWSRVGEAFVGFGRAVWIDSLLSADLGDGPMLYAAGTFGGPDDEMQNIAVWDGSAWLPLGEGLPYVPKIGALARIDTPEGPRLAASISVETAGNEEDVYLWDGTTWTPFGADTNGTVNAIAQPDDEFGAVYITGHFAEVSGIPSVGIARFGCEACAVDFNHDGEVDTRDVLAFLNLWAAGDDEADINEDGVVDTRDVLVFLNVWNAGC